MTAGAPVDPDPGDRVEDERFSGEPTGWLTVVARTRLAERVVGLSLADPAGAPLPAWSPGAHLDLVLPSGRLRSYSLCSRPGERSTYEIAVLAGGAGSAELHDPALLGRMLGYLGPRNHFELVDAPAYAFVAGGIGITPLLAMIEEVEAARRPWRLLYRVRSQAAATFAERLEACPRGRVEWSLSGRDPRPDLARLIDGLALGTAVYCCGPPGMIAAVEANAWRVGSRAVHTERFRRPRVVRLAAGEGEIGFDIELARTGRRLHVPPERTVLSVIRDVLPDVPSSCGTGSCGACETAVLAGRVDHRDRVLSAAAAEANESMMVCVSRSFGDVLVLDR